ncbi:MAG TPA: hypothetical protein VMH83_08755, partial [Candidatus Acidoferrum sp.]|nr:hypothetical protein [Candidatus Acidoferrum sp.]
MTNKALPFLSSATREQLLVVIVAFVQGVLLYLLYHAVDQHQWPSGHPVMLYLLASLLTLVPWFFLLLLEPGRLWRALMLVPVYGAVVAIAASFAGWQARPVEFVDITTMLPAYVLTMVIASFKALMYGQQYVRGERITYAALLRNSWRLFLLGGLSGAFVLLVQGVLLLWGALFKLIGVGVFSFVFGRSWFVIPSSTTAFGFALILFGNLDYVIDNIGRLLRTMMRLLLPLISIITLLFVAFLPFTGLQHIWDAKLGSLVLLWLMALLLFGVNAVYQSSLDSQLSTHALPYSLGLHRLIAAAVATLPIFGILAL